MSTSLFSTTYLQPNGRRTFISRNISASRSASRVNVVGVGRYALGRPRREMLSIWDKVEARWPALIGGRQVGFVRLKEELEAFLSNQRIIPRAFSHFGIVVSSIDASLGVLTELNGMKVEGATRAWVESYAVHVARGCLEGKELELIEPIGASFFLDFLKGHGEGLQHVGFVVEDIHGSLEKLDKTGVELADETPRAGSHGDVAFLKPDSFGEIHLELCQLREDGDK